MSATNNSGSVAAPPSPASPNAPSVTLPLRFMLAGMAALLLGTVLLVIRPEMLATYHYNQYVIATTHLFVLGWICTIVMGATYQLVPVALETRLYSERLAAIQFLAHVIGFSGMVWMFWKWNMKGVGHYGSLLGVGVLLYVYNMIRTLMRVPRWTVVASAVTASLGWLLLTIIVGLSVAAAKSTYNLDDGAPAATTGVASGLIHSVQAFGKWVGHFDPIGTMHAHAHLGVGGIFIMLIVGVSYRLIPMFTLSEVQSRMRAASSVALLNAGLAGTFLTILLRSPLKPVFAGGLMLGLVLFGVEIISIVRARKRRVLDWGVIQFLGAVGLVFIVAVIGAVLSWPWLPLTPATGQLENLYGFLAVMGVVSAAIIGMLYKILPFIVWYSCYSKMIGRAKVPCLADLYCSRAQLAGCIMHFLALAVLSFAILNQNSTLVRAGSAGLVLAVLLLFLNTGKMLSHFVRPRLGVVAERTKTTRARALGSAIATSKI